MTLQAILNVMDHFIYYSQSLKDSNWNLLQLEKLFNRVLPCILRQDSMTEEMKNFVINIVCDLRYSDIPRVFLCYLISKSYFPESPKLAQIDHKTFYINLIIKSLTVLKRHENVDFYSDLTPFVSNLMPLLNFYPLLETFVGSYQAKKPDEVANLQEEVK